jgi:hypothetical protein
VSSRGELARRAQERAEAPAWPDEWGYRVTLGEGSTFVGRWRGQAADTQDRAVFLLVDEDEQECFMRSYAALVREIQRVTPGLGDRIAIARGADYQSQHGTPGFSFGVEVEPCEDPVPGTADGDGIPF